LKRTRERIGKGLGGGEEEGQGVFGKTALSFPFLGPEQRRGEGSAAAGLEGGAPAALATATAGEWGNAERGTRGSHPRAHLGLGRAVEAAPREGSGAAAVLGGDGTVELGEVLCELGGAVWSGEEARGLFIGGLRRFGGEIFLRREVAGELARLLDVRPDFAATGDGTARAAAGQLVQGQRVQGRSGAGGLRWW
jgi:hypothetical protein